jgi:hypothetical protein
VKRLSRPKVLWAATLVASAAVVACVERTTYRDRPLFDNPPTAASGFLGYQREAEKLTTCGNCHVGQQSRWEETAHAGAWATLDTSGGSQTFCEGCHTVNQRGNASVDSTGGWVGTSDARYHDVQCENCHGPGLEHVENPDASQPLAPIAVGTELTVGCGECHSGAHHPFVEEWEQSRHARVNPTVLANVARDPVHYTECLSCHSAQGALEAWGVDANYVEEDAAPAEHQPIVCAVCHDPHGRRPGEEPIEKQLRYSVGVPDEERNLCVKCHHKRSQPDIDPVTLNSRGPHSPEGPLLLGENVGFWFGDTPYDNQRILGTHGTERNPRLCATCHIDRFEVVDSLTDEFLFQVTGHRFKAIPCVDGNGLPTSADDCEVAARTFRGCTTSGCHGSEEAARSAMLVAQDRVSTLAAELVGLIDQVRATEIASNDGRWSTAEGADFNYQLAVKRGSVVHNPFLIEALLTASIRTMRDAYGLAVSPSINLDNVLDRH